MILVDSSVWIDYFRGITTAQSDRVDELLGHERLTIGNIILTEVLQGFNRRRDFDQALRLLTSFVVIDIAGGDIAVKAARDFRMLRAKGITIRKTVDTRRDASRIVMRSSAATGISIRSSHISGCSRRSELTAP